MNKTFLTAIVYLFSLVSSGQSTDGSNYVVIKGKAKNHPQNFWEGGISSFIEYELISVPIGKDGSFMKSIPITHPQDFSLDINEDGIVLFAVPGDTLEINWDSKDFERSFQVISKIPSRQQELNLMIELSRKFRPTSEKLFDELDDKKNADSVKFKLVKSNFIDQVKVALSYPLTENSNKIFCDLYYRNIGYLKNAGLLSKYSLSFLDGLPKDIADNLQLSYMNLKTIDEGLFFRSYTYRDFIFNQVRFNDAFIIFRAEPSVFTSQTSEHKPNHTLKECSAGVATLQLSPVVLDWYLAKTIIFGFGRYSFEGAEEAYHTFFPKIKTALFRDTVQRFYNNIQRLKKGNKAPTFVLKNNKGEKVSLDDFKGKIVYLDFWGVYCGPCRYDIENDIPKLHERYKNKDVAFVNICVDVDEKEWKENLKKLKLDGINLLTLGWTNHPVCIDYNVNTVPHYVLIDQKGDILQANAPRPYELLGVKENLIDDALKNR